MKSLDFARNISAAFDRAERERRLETVPPDFRELVIETCALMFAGEIVLLPSVTARREAIEQLPEAIQKPTKVHIARWFQARAELRSRKANPPADLFEEAA